MFIQEDGFLKIPLKDVPRPSKEEGFDYIYRSGDWSFDIRDESDVERIEESILAWVGWLGFVQTGGYGTLENMGDDSGTETSG